MDAIISTVVTPVVESLLVPVKKHLGYLIFCTKYARDMGTKRKDLDDKRVNVEDHKNQNEINIFVVPAEVDGWLEKVQNLEEKAASISDDVGSCFNINRRHKLGRKAFKIIQEINSLIQENDMINWTDRRIPPAKVNSTKASTSTPSGHHNDFPSRERTFMEALEQLQPDNKTRMIALCGMGGVGKTTMMEKLKKVAEEKKLFNMIVKVAIGEKTDPIVIQQSVADFLGIDLKESDKGARAINLQKSFEATSDGGKKNILVILDDVWDFLDLNDIGLSPLPNQGFGFKILLTSRIRDVCIRMEVDSIFNVETIEDHEAQSFFHKCVKAPNGGDLDFNLHEIGNDIANRCHGLPMAIKTIAGFLKCYRSDKCVWENTLSSLKNKKVEEAVYKIFEISYNHLQDEEIRSTLLLCGVFPEDFDTPREDLVRYSWGLRLFNNVHTIREARNRVNTYIEQLINANLLIRSQLVNHVKMHDLVRSFVLKVCSNSEHASIVGDISKWTEENTSEFCKRISLTCTGMYEFPRNFKFPNLSLLKLMHGNKPLKFPEDFYEDMIKLQVIAYDQIEYPLLSRSLACSNLRTLCLYRCSLMFDFSSIGNLSNLEVLSLANCSVRRLPSTIGNLKELKLLDLTGCIDLIIDDGVLKNLIKIEEFYVKVGSINMYTHEKKAIRFTDSICNELAELSNNLFALEIEFFDNNVLPKNMSFKKLERFKISFGCYLDDGQNTHSYENTLMLVTDKCELLDFRINELFEKTEVLRLQVNGVNNLGDGLVESLCHQRSPFYNLRVLEIRKCENLRYLFTVCVANGLTKLERLTVLSCPVLETLVDGESGELGVIKFQVLKFLSLRELPKLMSLCNAINVIELPQLEELILDSLPNFTSIYPDYSKSATSSMSNDISTTQPFLNKEVVIPQLKKLKISKMERLKEIWLSNPISFWHNLEELYVERCSSIKVLFNIDLRRVGKYEEVGSCLRRIEVSYAENLREVWRIKGANDAGDHIINGFQAIESIVIVECRRFRNVFTPTTTNFDLRALTKLTINDHGESERADEMVNRRQEQEKPQVNDVAWSLCQYARKIDIRDCEALPYVIPSNALGQLQKLENMRIWSCKSLVEVFEAQGFNIDKGSGGNDATMVIPRTKIINVPQLSNLKELEIQRCDLLQHVFTFSTLESLRQLEELRIIECKAMKVIVKEDNGEQTTMSSKVVLFPRLKYIELHNLPNLVGFFLGMDEFQWPLLDFVMINACPQMIVFTSGCSIAPKLNYIHTKLGKHSLECGLNFRVMAATLHESLFSSLDTTNSCATSSEGTPWSFRNLIEVDVKYTGNVKNIIPSNELLQLQKLEKIHVVWCNLVEEVFEALEGTDSKLQSVVVEVPKLREVELRCLDNLKYIWKNNPWMVLEFPNLTKLSIKVCNSLEHVFSSSMVGSLFQLQDLHIHDCRKIEVIVKKENGVVEEGGEEECDDKVNNEIIMLPRLKSLKLEYLPSLKGFYLGKEAFSLPSLDTLEIIDCPAIRVFTKGDLATPELKVIDTSFGRCELVKEEEDLNSFINTKLEQQGLQF